MPANLDACSVERRVMPALVKVVCLPDRSNACQQAWQAGRSQQALRAGAVAEVGTVAECLPRR
jgi:hypothetical protein